MDKQFEKVEVFDGSKPSECHPWLEEVHALCIQTGRPFRKMLLLCAGQAVRDFITDMSPEATDDQIKNDLITGYLDLQGLGCKQAAYPMNPEILHHEVQQTVQAPEWHST